MRGGVFAFQPLASGAPSALEGLLGPVHVPAGLSQPATETRFPAFQFHNTICEGTCPAQVLLGPHPDHAKWRGWWQTRFWIWSSYSKCVALIWQRVARPPRTLKKVPMHGRLQSLRDWCLDPQIKRNLWISKSLLKFRVAQDVLTYHGPKIWQF